MRSLFGVTLLLAWLACDGEIIIVSRAGAGGGVRRRAAASSSSGPQGCAGPCGGLTFRAILCCNAICK